MDTSAKASVWQCKEFLDTSLSCESSVWQFYMIRQVSEKKFKEKKNKKSLKKKEKQKEKVKN